MEIDLIVEEGGIIHVPFPEGTAVRVQSRKFSDYTREEWTALIHAVSGSIPDIERPVAWPSRSVEPLD